MTGKEKQMSKKTLQSAIENQRTAVDAAKAKEQGSMSQLASSAGKPSGLPRPNIIDDTALIVACCT